MYITARVIKDSIYQGKRVTTLSLQYPRFIHSQLMTHRMLSKNSASSRAIPIDDQIISISTYDQVPLWTGAKPGMVGDVITQEQEQKATLLWYKARNNAIRVAKQLALLGVHKQDANRLLEPFQTMTTIITGTEWDNFFKLRIHPHAQPEIQELAKAIKQAMDNSTPTELLEGEWHMPYISDNDLASLGEEMCKKISVSCCAQVSYRKLNTSVDKALAIYDKLVSGDIIHGSAFEHICRPLKPGEKQVGNLLGFRQFRHDIEDAYSAK